RSRRSGSFPPGFRCRAGSRPHSGGVMGGGQPGRAHLPVPDNPVSEHVPVAGWPPVPGYPAVPPYLSVRDGAPVPDWPPAPGWRPRLLLRRLARRLRRCPAADGRARRAAVAGYLTVPVFPVPLVIYLTTLRGPGWARQHAAQAVNAGFTGLLYDLS